MKSTYQVIIYIVLGGILFFTNSNISLGDVVRVITVPQGGTGSSTLSGILIGNGTNPVRTVTIGSNLSLVGTTLSATTGDGTFSFTPTTNYNAGTNATNTPMWFQQGLQASSTSRFSNASTTQFSVIGTATSTFNGSISLNLGNHIVAHGAQGDGSDGFHIDSTASGPTVALFGPSGGTGATFYGGVNIDGTTRLATSLTGLLKATAGVVSTAIDGADYISSSFKDWRIANGALTPTTTLGIGVFASSTIGSGSQTGGLTISGGATTTGNAYFAKNVLIGTTTPSGNLGIEGSTPILRINPKSGTRGLIRFIDDGNSSQGWEIIEGGPSFGTDFFSIREDSTTEHLRISSGGNIGLGTTTPWGKLSVTNTGTSPSFVVEDSTSPDLTPFVVDASGNVGVGTTTIASKLHVDNTSAGAASNALLLSNFSANASTEVQLRFAPSVLPSSRYSYISTLQAGSSGQNLLDMVFATGGAALPSEKLRIRYNGFIGVSSSTPSQMFSVQGNGLFSGDVSLAGLTATGTVTFTGISSGLVKSTSGVLSTASAGTDYTTPANVLSSISAFKDWQITNGALTPTTTLGIGVFASSTIGNGTAAGGLTILGGATTTGNAYFAGNVGIGTVPSTDPNIDLTVSTFINTALGYLIGSDVVLSVNNGFDITKVGVSAAPSATGNFTTAIGDSALFSQTDGTGNTAVGAAALYTNTTSNNNTAVGFSALYTNTGSDNVAIGTDALVTNSTGSFNTAVGKDSLVLNTSGIANTAIGYGAGFNVTTGEYNIFTGFFGESGNITTGKNNILIGQDVRYGLNVTGDDQLNIGNLLFASGIGSSTILGTGKFGVGTSTPWGSLSVLSNHSTNFVIATSTGRLSFKIDNKAHVTSGGYTPSVSSCGTSPAIYGNDTNWRLHAGGTLATSCTITFASGFDNPPVCTVTQETGTPVAVVASSTPTTLVISGATFTDNWFVGRCEQYN